MVSMEYLAGYLDGEGCFTFVGTTIRNKKIMVACETTFSPVIRTLKEAFGGSYTKNIRKRKKCWRPTYRWVVVSRDAENACTRLLPI